MGRLLRALRSIRAPHLWAAGLLALAAAVSWTTRGLWIPRPWNPERCLDPDLPRDLLAWACLVGAASLVARRTRPLGVALGFSAAIAAVTSATSRNEWGRFGPFGDRSPFDLPWTIAVAALLPLAPVVRGPRSVGAASRTAVLGGGVLVWLAFVKMPTLYVTKCDDRWLSEDTAMTGAELWTGLLALAPATRFFGAVAGSLLMGGAAAFAFRQSELGTPWRGCHCFGTVDAPWHVHFVVAALLASLLAVAALLDAPRFFAARASGPGTSLLDETRAAATKRGARFGWTPRVGAALVAVLAASRLLSATFDYVATTSGASRYPRAPADLLPDVLLATQGLVAALLLGRGRRRLAGAYLAALFLVLELSSYESRGRWFGWSVLPIWLPMAALVLCVLAAFDAGSRTASSTRLRGA